MEEEETDYKRIREIGQGGFGKCFLVEDKNQDEYVEKIINLENSTKEEVAKALREVNILQSIDDCYYITKFIESRFKNKKLKIFLEYVIGGDLQKKIYEQKKIGEKNYFEENQIILWMIQICYAVSILHENNIIHRDIKPSNLLLTNDNKIKVTDFGLSTTDNQYVSKTIAGTFAYTAPEVLDGEKYDKKVDSWSIGITLLELCTLETPKQMKIIRTLSKGGEISIPNCYSDILKKVLKMSLQLEPKDRSTVKEIFELVRNYRLSKLNINISDKELENILKKFSRKNKNSIIKKNMKIKLGIYSGEVDQEGKRNGIGIYKNIYKDVYEGEWKNDKSEGKGINKWENGAVYEGEFKNGKYEGKAIYKYSNGDEYEGEFKNGKREGKGIYKYSDGDVYEGEFKNGKSEGKGIYKYSNGDVYECEFKNDKSEGKGIYKYSNGEVFEGEFKNDKRKKGIIKYPDGKTENYFNQNV